jgi:ribosomal protein S18 acetylase RimI-like enzyme
MRKVVVVSPDQTLRLTEIGELTALAYLADGILDSADPCLPRLRDAQTRASQAILLMAASGAKGEGAALGTLTVVPPHTPFAEFGADDYEFRMLAVSPLARAKGIGQELTRFGLSLAIEAGAQRVLLSTMQTMTAAHALYEKVGFVRIPELDWTAHGGSPGKTQCDESCRRDDGTCAENGSRLLAYVWESPA